MLEGKCEKKNTGEAVVNKNRREENNRERSSNRSTYHLGVFFTIIKVREGDIHHFIFLLRLFVFIY